MELKENLRLSPELWKDGNYPTMKDYKAIMKRGTMLYTLDTDTKLNMAELDSITAIEADMRPCNLLYHTAMENYLRTGTQGFKGFARNEDLLKSLDKEKEHISSLHDVGIPVIVYQNENNFDQAVFSSDEINSMAAELNPFVWGFNNEGRRFACYNKVVWIDYLVERLIIRVGKYGADGVFMDNNTPFMHCRCEVCQELYFEKFGRNMIEDMGTPNTVVGDMRVFDYVGAQQIPKDLVRVDNPILMGYLEWRIECIINFHKEIRSRIEASIGRDIIYTSNGHVGIAEQSAVMIADLFDMIFSEDGFTAPPASNGFNIRLGTSIGEGERCAMIITRTLESAPVADMVKVLNAEGRALGGQAEFWDVHIRFDDKLKAAQRISRKFFVDHAEDLYTLEKDKNDIAVVYSWRSDLWTSQAISPAKMFAALLEDINQPYDVLIAERQNHVERLDNYKLVVMPNVEILSDVWYDAVDNYINNNGKLITTGTTARFDENLKERLRTWESINNRHFESNPEKEYYHGRKPIGIHSGYKRPEGELVAAVDDFLASPSCVLIDAQPLLTLNHTSLPNGESVHIVNRYVNVMPFVHLVPRKNLVLRIKPKREVGKIEWLSPDGSSKEDVTYKMNKNGLEISVPELQAYGIIRLYYI